MACSVNRTEVLAVLVLASCAAGPEIDRASDQYETCGDASGWAAFERATALRNSGAAADALAESLVALERCPDLVPAHVLFQDLARERGGGDEAAMREYYRELADRAESPVPPFALARLADEDFSRQQLLDLAIARDPSFYPAYVERARMLRRLGRTVEALDALQLALTARPQCAEANLEIAGVLSGLGRGQEAAPHYARYVELVPADLATKQVYLELLVYSLDRLDEAEVVARELLQRDPDNSAVLMDVAAIAWLRGEHLRAAQLYHRVLESDPTRDRAVLNLGNLYYGPLAAGGDARQRESWTKARAAYRYFLAMRRAEGLFDALDYHVGVPYRLGRIEALLGPAPQRDPTPADF